MSDNVQVDELAIAHAADTEYLVRRGMGKGYQLLSLATPPLYAAFVIARKGRSHITVNRFLRATWVGGAAGALPPAISHKTKSTDCLFGTSRQVWRQAGRSSMPGLLRRVRKH